MVNRYPNPSPFTPPAQVPLQKKKGRMDDMFEVPKSTDNDMDTSDLFAPPDENDADIRIDDLVDVDVRKDIMGGDIADVTGVAGPDREQQAPPRVVVANPKYKRTTRVYRPETTIRGMTP